MYFRRYMGVMVSGKPYSCPESRRFENMRVIIDDVNADTVTENGHEYMSTARGWLKRRCQIDSQGALISATNCLSEMPWVSSYEEVDY